MRRIPASLTEFLETLFGDCSTIAKIYFDFYLFRKCLETLDDITKLYQDRGTISSVLAASAVA